MDENRVKIDSSNPAIQRIEEKCIRCGHCLNVCTETVGLDRKCRLEDGGSCIYCGQCILACPMGALREQYDYKKVLNLLVDTEDVVTISIAPAVRVTVGEELGKEVGTSLEKELPSILRALGFSYVFDVTFGADVTIMEEASELLDRIKNGGSLPMFTSCCPSWVKYVYTNRRDIIPNLSTTKSPIGIMGSLIKSYFKEMMGIDKRIINVVVAPCTAKKWEIMNSDVDYVITTRELALMIKEVGLDLEVLKTEEPDVLLGHGSKAGLIFGRSGGVMEAALSTLYYLSTGNTPRKGQFKIDGDDAIKKSSFKMGERIVNVAVVSGLSNLETILAEKDDYDFIEVMNCPGGCIGGGGQPLVVQREMEERVKKRRRRLDQIDDREEFSFENESIKELYKSYLIHPGSKLAEELLHKDDKEK